MLKIKYILETYLGGIKNLAKDCERNKIYCYGTYVENAKHLVSRRRELLDFGQGFLKKI